MPCLHCLCANCFSLQTCVGPSLVPVLACATLQGFPEGVGGKSGDAARVCATILLKLVMDMVLKAGTSMALPLTLVLLHRSAPCSRRGVCIGAHSGLL